MPEVGIVTNEPKQGRTWQRIAEEASGEFDSAKLLNLALELEQALDQQFEKLKAPDPVGSRPSSPS